MFREPAENPSIRIQDLRKIVPPKVTGLIVPFKQDLRKRETVLIKERRKNDETIYFLILKVMKSIPKKRIVLKHSIPRRKGLQTASLHCNVTNLPNCCATLLRY